MESLHPGSQKASLLRSALPLWVVLTFVISALCPNGSPDTTLVPRTIEATTTPKMIVMVLKFIADNWGLIPGNPKAIQQVSPDPR